jgi:hypothetical protein
VSIVYAQEQTLSVADYVAVLSESKMRDKRPLQNSVRIARMLAGANFIVTARQDGAILGLARCITDYAWVCYCAELVVRESAQGAGTGAGLVGKIGELLGPGIALTLISEPWASGFYERVGMTRQDSAFFRTRLDRS